MTPETKARRLIIVFRDQETDYSTLATTTSASNCAGCIQRIGP